jgi:hypothetical protein
VHNVYITNQFQTTFAQGGRGGWGVNPLEEVSVNSKEENSEDFVSIASANSASGLRQYVANAYGICNITIKIEAKNHI